MSCHLQPRCAGLSAQEPGVRGPQANGTDLLPHLHGVGAVLLLDDGRDQLLAATDVPADAWSLAGGAERLLAPVGHAGTLAANVGLYRKLPYSAIEDFEPSGFVDNAPKVRIVKQRFPAQTVGELYEKAGTVRPLAVLRAERIAALPDVPTTAETRLENMEANIWNLLLAPKGKPSR